MPLNRSRHERRTASTPPKSYGRNGGLSLVPESPGARTSRRYPLQKASKFGLVFVNQTPMPHPMHLHGHEFQVVEIDGKRFAGQCATPCWRAWPSGRGRLQSRGFGALHCHLLLSQKQACSRLCARLMRHRWLLIRLAAQNVGRRRLRRLSGAAVMLGVGIAFASFVAGGRCARALRDFARMGADLVVVHGSHARQYQFEASLYKPTESDLHLRSGATRPWPHFPELPGWRRSGSSLRWSRGMLSA